MPWLTPVFRLGGFRVLADGRGAFYVRWRRAGRIRRLF